jgi:hypothetical protein
LCPLGIARFTIAEWENQVVACLVTVQAARTISPNVLNFDQSTYKTQAISLLVDESVRALILQGYCFWNWESSPSRDHPVYKFKAHWGSQEFSYRILLRYPKGRTIFSDMSREEIAAEYPFYFVTPFEDLGGNLES